MKKFDPASKTEAEMEEFRKLKQKTREECATAFKRGYADGLGNKTAKGYPEKDLNAAYQEGYAKAGKGLRIKL
jgi:hypothetical protein